MKGFSYFYETTNSLQANVYMPDRAERPVKILQDYVPSFRCNEILRKIWRCVDPFSGWKWIRSYRTELHGPLASTRPRFDLKRSESSLFPSPLLPFSSFLLKAFSSRRRISQRLERDSSRRPSWRVTPYTLSLSGSDWFEFFSFFFFFFSLYSNPMWK